MQLVSLHAFVLYDLKYSSAVTSDGVKPSARMLPLQKTQSSESDEVRADEEWSIQL